MEYRQATPELVVVGSEKERRIAEIEHLGWNLTYFLKNRNPENKEETVNLLYNTFCELDEQFTGGDCAIELQEEKNKNDIAKFLKLLPERFASKKRYRAELQIKLCYGAMTVELVEADNGQSPIMGFGTVGATSEISEVFVGNKIYHPGIK